MPSSDRLTVFPDPSNKNERIVVGLMYAIPPSPSTLSTQCFQSFYNKAQPYKNQSLCVKPEFSDIANMGYLWSSEEAGSLPTDFEELQSGTIYGLHTYGGYPVFFRPDLSEVICLLSTVISENTLESIETIYVTTIAHPAPDVSQCYDNNTDRHQAVTTYAISYKNDIA
jgi:hypothetical protein